MPMYYWEEESKEEEEKEEGEEEKIKKKLFSHVVLITVLDSITCTFTNILKALIN